ncbi:MAG: enoyl-CoA hydratase-related protein [Rhodocyclaceae bacterium]|jgi:2-(1,2-epoxy-1,2-dihydrophenyl)acetyl-CoA isomerase|nr:enoyl-CoA hydratase-related protein [Rhodocyclaceae bacterium]
MDDKVLLEDVRDGLAVLTLNRPERLNALNGELMDALLEATRRLAEDPEVRVLILAGAGKGFCAGGDIREGDSSRDAPGEPHRKRSFDERVWSRYARMQTVRHLQEMPKPTIALLRGPVMGAGMSLALACDFRIAADSAVMRSAFVNVALSGDYGIGHSLNRIVGSARAVEILMLADKISAQQAAEWGLVHRVVEDAQLEEQGLALAARLAEGPTQAYAAIKSNLAAANAGMGIEPYLLHEVRNQTGCHKTEDVREAGRAFMEKRAPKFKGR